MEFISALLAYVFSDIGGTTLVSINQSIVFYPKVSYIAPNILQCIVGVRREWLMCKLYSCRSKEEGSSYFNMEE